MDGAVIDHQRHTDFIAQVLIVLIAVANQHKTNHIPHGCEFGNFLPGGGYLEHEEEACPVNRSGKGVDGGGNESILQHMILVFFMVVDDNTDDF